MPADVPGRGGYLVVDHSPGAMNGRTFIWEPENGEDAMGSWPSLEELCIELRTALMGGGSWMGTVYRIVDGGVEWD